MINNIAKARCKHEYARIFDENAAFFPCTYPIEDEGVFKILASTRLVAIVVDVKEGEEHYVFDGTFCYNGAVDFTNPIDSSIYNLLHSNFKDAGIRYNFTVQNISSILDMYPGRSHPNWIELVMKRDVFLGQLSVEVPRVTPQFVDPEEPEELWDHRTTYETIALLAAQLAKCPPADLQKTEDSKIAHAALRKLCYHAALS